MTTRELKEETGVTVMKDSMSPLKSFWLCIKLALG